jgi:hypothetical protein
MRSMERAVLTFNPAKASFGLRPIACVIRALVLTTITLSSAHADKLYVGGCVGGWGAGNCVLRIGPAGDPYIRLVPQPGSEVEKARAAERDRAWESRCQPVIAQDRFGVPRYYYAAPGCEFGVIQ